MILFLHSLKSSGYDVQALLYSVQAAAYAIGYQAARSRVHAPPGLYLAMFVTYLFLSIVHRSG